MKPIWKLLKDYWLWLVLVICLALFMRWAYENNFGAMREAIDAFWANLKKNFS